ncbi:xanthine dehydrogenase accessory protein XdhC [Nocardioides panaciterrulae]|nr:xanthine dehydrogenase accessory protein XdhC [Nocardioides panaciterrulae]
MDWLGALARLRETRTPGVLVTVAGVRGHAPRQAGAKMVVSASATWGSVGGGNLEAVAVERARAMLAASSASGTSGTSGSSGSSGSSSGASPELLEVGLSDRAAYQHGVQCCGGEVTLLLEPLAVVPAVAVFGMGHVGWELARILARHELDLHLVDSRPDQLSPARLSVLDDAVARVHVHPVPVLPELVLGGLPRGSHVLVMTHDHAEDAALCDAALRLVDGDPDRLGTLGLIGSSAKWARFRSKLLAEGHPAAALDRVTTPIGLPELAGKDPATIAVGVAATLLRSFAPSDEPVRDEPGPDEPGPDPSYGFAQGRDAAR